MRRLWILPAVLMLGPGFALAQETTGNIQGRLRSAQGEPVVAARIAATSPDLLGTRRAVSSGDGVFTLLTLPPGSYTLRVAAIGYRPVVIEGVSVQLGRVTGLGVVVLERAAVSLTEITVTAPGVTLDPVHTTIGATLDSREYANLPGERDYTSVLSILPHANRSYRGDPLNVAGSTGLENMYFIDGVNVTAPERAETGTRLPYNFVKAIEVKTGGYEAQYGRASGAVINAVTYSGTNHFEGSVFVFLTSDRLAASPKAAPALREVGSLSYDIGVRLSGPLVRDRLWFSTAYNPRRQRVNREIGGLGVFEDVETAQIFAGKLTWEASSALNVELSLFGDPSTHSAVKVPTGWFPDTFTPLSADPYLVRVPGGGTVGSLRAAWSLGRQVLIEASLARSQGQSGVKSTAVGEATPLYVDYVTRTVSGGWPEWNDHDVGRWSALVRGRMNLGGHTVIAGLEYEDAANRGIDRQSTIVRNAPELWVVGVGNFPGNFHNRTPTAYLQDAWRVSDRLTVNAGLRWSTQTLTGARSLVAQRFLGEWQPRLGLVWQPGAIARQRVFASLGRYYQQFPLWLSPLPFGDYEYVNSFFSRDPRESGVSPDSVHGGAFAFDPATANLSHLAVEHYDELTLGYERLVGASTKLTARVLRRDLRSSFGLAYDFVGGRGFIIGTPGKGALDFLPKTKREYTALELSAEGTWRGTTYRGSYVLSRNWGNYAGLYDSDLGVATPGNNRTFNSNNHAVNTTGLLPNDRTHVVKLSGAHRMGIGLTTGVAFTWASGSPLNAFAPCPCDIDVFRSLTVPRGSVGRTPSIWTLDLRLGYDLASSERRHARVLLDVLNVGNPQGVVWQEELRYLRNSGGVPSEPNPDYLKPIAFQPPMLARLGLELSF